MQNIAFLYSIVKWVFVLIYTRIQNLFKIFSSSHFHQHAPKKAQT